MLAPPASDRALILEREETERASLLALAALAEIAATRSRFARIHRTHKDVPLDFDRYPYLRDIYEETAREIDIKKSAQTGITELLLLHSIAASARGYAVLYWLPDKDLVGKFVQERVNKPLKLVPIYRQLVETAVGETDRVGMKHLGPGSIFYQGSKDAGAGIADAGDVLIIDEYDECDTDALARSDSRLEGSAVKQQIRVSNPSLPKVGISALYEKTDARKWHVVCPRCSLAQPLEWRVNVVEAMTDSQGNVRDYRLRDRNWTPDCGRDIQVLCRNCHEPLPRLERDPQRAFWRPTNPGAKGRGYHLSALFSPNTRVDVLWGKFRAALNNPTLLQAFYNLRLGEAYSPPGAQLTRDILEGCVRVGWRLPSTPPAGSRGVTMGIDVGRFFHVRISDRPAPGERRALFIGTITDTPELIKLARRFRVRAAVIDELPETREAKKIVDALRRLGVKAWRIGGTGGDRRSEDSGKNPGIDEEERRVVYGRTLLLDDAMKDILDLKNVLPLGAAELDDGEYYEQMMRNSRVIVKTKSGSVYRWTNEKPNDHRFADAYDKLAGHHLLAGRMLWGSGKVVTGGRASALDRPESFL